MKLKKPLMVVLLLGVTLQFLYLNAPIDRDSGYYLYAGHLILAGKVPFRDYFDHKPPGMHYFVAAVFKFFGESLFAVRYATILVNVLSGVLLYLIGRRLWISDVGLLAGVLFLFGVPLYEGYATISEEFILLFTALGVFLYLAFLGGNSLPLLFFSGVSFGISFVFKQTGALVFLALLLFHAIRLWMTERRLLNVESFVLGLGFLLPIILSLGYMASEGALPAFLDSVFSKNVSSYAASGLGAFIEYSFKNVMSYPLVWAFAACAVFIPRKLHDNIVLILLALAASLVPTIVRQYPHYYIPALGYASLLSSVALSKLNVLLSQLPAKFRFIKVSCYVLVVLLIAPLFFGIAVEYRLMQEEHLLKDYFEVGDYVRTHTNSSERILVIAKEPQFYLLSQREAPNEFIFLSEVDYYDGVEEKMIQDSLIQGVRYFVVVEKPYLYKYAGKINDFVVENSVLEKTWPGKYPIKVYRRVT